MQNTQIALDWLKSEKRNSVEQMSLMLLHEKNFVRLAGDDSKGMSYRMHTNIDYELYYRHKANVTNCDVIISIITRNSNNLENTISNYQSYINKDSRYPHQSTSPVFNHEHLIDVSVRQTLIDTVNILINKGSI